MPGEELREPLDRMIGDPAEHVGEPGLRIDVVELGRADQQGSGALAVAITTGEQIILAADGNHAVILPISGKKLRSMTAGTRCMGAGFGDNMSSGVPSVKLFT